MQAKPVNLGQARARPGDLIISAAGETDTDDNDCERSTGPWAVGKIDNVRQRGDGAYIYQTDFPASGVSVFIDDEDIDNNPGGYQIVPGPVAMPVPPPPEERQRRRYRLTFLATFRAEMNTECKAVDYQEASKIASFMVDGPALQALASKLKVSFDDLLEITHTEVELIEDDFDPRSDPLDHDHSMDCGVEEPAERDGP